MYLPEVESNNDKLLFKKFECSVFCLNVQSLPNKINALNIFLSENPFDILCVSEHWLDINSLRALKLPYYNLISAYCRETRKDHGGVAIYAKENLELRSVDVTKFCKPVDAEFCGVELKNMKCIIITIYRSSTNGDMFVFTNLFSELVDHLWRNYKKIIIMGDFNLNLDDNTEHSKSIRNILAMYGLRHVVHTPTRITLTSESCLDNVIINLQGVDTKVGVCEPLISDHSGTFLFFKSASVESNVSYKKRIINNSTLTNFANRLSNYCWDDYKLASLNSNECTDTIIDILKTCAETCFPLRSVYYKNHCIKWFNRELREMRKEVFSLRKNFRNTKTPDDWRSYCDMRRQYKKALKEGKRNAYADIITNADNKSREIWKIFNKERQTKYSTSKCSSLHPDQFNNFFATVSDAVINSIRDPNIDPLSYLNGLNKPPFSFFMSPITESDVLEAILSLPNKPGLDYHGLNAIIIKSSLDSLVEPLTVIFNKCLDEGNWPLSLKISKIIPVFKKGNECDLGNYRPIAIVPVISKIFEKILKGKLISYLETKSLLSTAQFGFQKHKSTTTALISVLEEVVEGLDQGASTNAVMCDLTKAFDCVTTDILIRKMEFYGLRGQVLNLFNSYLVDRFQYVNYNNLNSSLSAIKNGVPQGSVLGPILFLLYVNDLPSVVSRQSSVVLFADDTTILTRGDEAMSRESLDVTKIWFAANKLKINESKTQNMLFSTDKFATKSKPVKLLGITFDTSLNWSSHIDTLCSKLSTQLFLMRQLRSGIKCNRVMATAYYALVHSHLTYGVILWGCSSSAHKAFSIQKAAVRIVDAAECRAHCREVFKKYKILPLPCIYLFESLMQIHKNLPTIIRHSDLHGYNTRGADNLVTSYSRISTTQQNKIDVRLYNKLDLIFKDKHIKDMSVNNFHKFVKTFLVEHCFYTVAEFLEYNI